MLDSDGVLQGVDPATRQVIVEVAMDMAGAPVEFVYRELVRRLRGDGLPEGSIEDMWNHADAISDGTHASNSL